MDDGTTFPIDREIDLAGIDAEARRLAREEVSRLAPEYQTTANWERMAERLREQLVCEALGLDRGDSP
jgi:hypothetical protein